jgi:hypothetical protein
MPAIELPSAAFFDMVHRLLEEDAAQRPRDRRIDKRRPYRCKQLLAPYDRQRLPTPGDFKIVSCEDISQRGLAFFEKQPPAYDHVVVALGAVPFTFLTAEVVHHKPVRKDGGTQYLVGCRFSGRIGS